MQRLPTIMTAGPARRAFDGGGYAAGPAMRQMPTMVPLSGMGRSRFMQSYKKGGQVKKTGIYKLHKGERVISLAQIMRGKI